MSRNEINGINLRVLKLTKGVKNILKVIHVKEAISILVHQRESLMPCNGKQQRTCSVKGF